MESWNLLIEIVALLGACLVLGGFLSYLRQSPLVGYLLAGMLLSGPGSFGFIQSKSDIESIAELGVSLLLFSLGLEFSWRQLKKLGSKTLGAGAAQVLLTALVGTGAAFLLGLTIKTAIAIGAIVALSSTAAVLRVLTDRAEIESAHGRNSLAVLLVQDMAVVPLTLLLAILAGSGGFSEIALNAAKIVGLALAFIATLYLLLHFVAVRALLALSVERNRELTVLLAVVVGLGATWAAHAMGLSPALGAFIAGMFLGSSPFAMQIRADVSSLRVVLLTLFFGSVGMVADPIWIMHNLGAVLAVAGVILLGKTGIVWLIFRMLRQPKGISLATGLCVAQIGEFSFVLGTIGKTSGILSDSIYMLIVSSAIVTLLITPYLVQLAPRAALWIERLGKRTPTVDTKEDTKLNPDVVIIGFGPAGRAVATDLVDSEHQILVLDLNHSSKNSAEAMGLAAKIGDATQLEVLEHAGLRHAKIIVLTLPSQSAALAVLHNVRRLAPAAHIVVRSRYQRHQRDFEAAGAHVVIGDEEQVGQSLSSYVLENVESWESEQAD